MSTHNPPHSSSGVPSAVMLMQMATGEVVAQLIAVTATLGIADHLAEGPKSSEHLAQAVGAHPRALYRVLRALASLGVFAEDSEGRFGLTPLAEPLCTQAPDSMHARVSFAGQEWWWRVWGNLLYSVQTNQPAFPHVYGVPVFDYFQQHAEAAAVFHAGMAQVTGPEAAAVVAAYDFSGITTLTDIGGGQGALMTAILKAYPQARGQLFEVPSALAGARQVLATAGLTDRCELIPGDFFSSVPAGGEIYMLKDIIHDWDDEHALTLLKNCRQAMTPAARLLVIERVLPPGNAPFFGKLVDIGMLVLTGGQERTEAEYAALLTAADFQLTRVIPTQSAASVLEAVPV